MNRGFLYLALATLVVLLAVFLVERHEGSTQDNRSESALFMPDLSNTINDVDQVTVLTAGNIILATLKRDNNGNSEQWQVEEMHDYAANWPVLQKVLANLAKARVVEVKTDKPEYYSRLGVADLASENADGIMLELSANGKVNSVIVGHRAKNRPGQYVRLQSSEASDLIDQTLDVPFTLRGWVDKRIVDISASEVAQVEVLHPDQQRVLIMRISADQKDFDLADKPLDREIRGTWAVNSLAGTLSMLDMEAVRPAADEDWSDAVKMRVLLFSGIEVMADLIETSPEISDAPSGNGVAGIEEGNEDLAGVAGGAGAGETEYLLRLTASNPKTDFAPMVNNKAAVANAEEAVKQQVADINQRVSGWVYRIPKQKFDAMVKRPEDLLKPVQQEE